jgi:hypothetical protein
MAGKDWLKGFCQRQNLSLRKPEQCSPGRVIGFNQVQCGTFFKNLKLCYETKGFKSHRVFNIDKSGISTVPNKTPKVISPVGKKDVCKVSSGERGTADANATGRKIMTNESGNVTYLRIQSGNHDSSLLPPATGIKVSMSEISPLPICTKERKRKRAPQKSQILSSSLCKRNLEEKEREKLKEKNKQN